jgi:NADH-quinone oxidoreductase subunit G
VHTELEATPGFVPLKALTSPDLIVPAHDTLFTSGTLGQYSTTLRQLTQHQANELAETAAD